MSQDAETPKIIEIADGFFVRQEIDNITWVDLGGFAIAVDALEHREKEATVFKAISETLGETPVRYLLNTHTHYDHVALNDAFERRGAEIVNLETCNIPADGRWFEGEHRGAQMIPAAGLHTDTDCLVWVPRDRVLLVGDLFGWGIIPLIRRLNDKSATELLDTCERMIAFGAETVIPGHGPLATTDHLRRFVRYFNDLRRDVAASLDAGKDEGAIARELGPPEDMADWWRFAAWKHEDTLAKVTSAVRRGNLSAPK